MRTWWIVVGAAVLSLMMIVLIAILHGRAVRHSLERMNPEERRAAYVANMRSFARTCETPELAEHLSTLCRDQAIALRRFPECDSKCLARTSPFIENLPPTR